jgi:hypothetical protein
MQTLNNTTAVETTVAETAAAQRVYVRNMLRAEFKRCVEAGHLLDGSGSTPLRKHLLNYVVQLGGAKNSGPAEYNVVLLELIAANVVMKVARGVLVAVAPTLAALKVNSELPATEAATVATEATVTGAWLICNKATGAVEGSADSKNKAYAAKTAEQVVRKAATV